MKRKKSKTTKQRRAVKDLTTRKAGPIKGKGANLGAGKVNVADLSFTHHHS
jgi:hypothetical protein